jgi:hypothetical protein
MHVSYYRSKIVLLALSGWALQGCGGGDDSTAAASNDAGVPSATSPPTLPAPPAASEPPPAADTPNRAPTITGTPATSVLPGALYSFQPEATDPDGNALTFSVVNLPAWATFDELTGLLRGTPGAGDVGTVTGIVISVSDGVAAAALPALDLSVLGVASGQVQLTWNPPTTNADGSPLTNLAGFKVYWGTTPGNYSTSATIMNPGIASYLVENLTPNTYHFAVTALNASGTESEPSDPFSKTIP